MSNTDDEVFAALADMNERLDELYFKTKRERLWDAALAALKGILSQPNYSGTMEQNVMLAWDFARAMLDNEPKEET